MPENGRPKTQIRLQRGGTQRCWRQKTRGRFATTVEPQDAPLSGARRRKRHLPADEDDAMPVNRGLRRWTVSDCIYEPVLPAMRLMKEPYLREVV